MSKDNMISVRFNNEDYAYIKQYAEEVGESEAGAVRELTQAGIKARQEQRKLQRIEDEIQDLNQTLEQISKDHEDTGFISSLFR